MRLTKTRVLVLSASLLILAGVLFVIVSATGRPVTIGDGSLTVGSTNYPYWVDPSDNVSVLTPVGSVLVAGDYGWSVEYDYSDSQGPHRVDLSPAGNQALNLTIYYGKDTVSITTDTSHRNLKIISQKYKFKKKFWWWKRYHENEKDSISRVESCQPVTSACTFIPTAGTSYIGFSYHR